MWIKFDYALPPKVSRRSQGGAKNEIIKYPHMP